MANRCLNKVMLIGNLTRDPELRYTAEGIPVCTFGLATNRTWVTNEGQKKEDVQYHRVVAWQKLGELCAKLLTKGKKVYVEGRLTYRTFIGKDNQEKTLPEIVLDDFISLDSRKKGLENEEGVQNEVKTATETEEKSNESDLKVESFEEQVDKEDVNPDDIPF